MNTDIRLHIEFFGHAKTRRMERTLGPDGVLGLLRLWVYAAKHRPSGVLTGMDADDIEDTAGWPRERRGEFFEYCKANRWLESAGRDTWAIHEWTEYNSWAAGAPARTEKGKKGAHARYHRNDPRPGCRWCAGDAMDEDDDATEESEPGADAETVRSGEREPMSWAAYTARAREVAKWSKRQQPMSEEAFAAAFEAEFEMTWDQWNAIKTAMSRLVVVA